MVVRSIQITVFVISSGTGKNVRPAIVVQKIEHAKNKLAETMRLIDKATVVD
jgi:hypothetical protein